MRVSLLLPSLLVLLPITLAGCSRSASSAVPLGSDSAAQQRRQEEVIREDLERIPPPSKTRYLAVKSLTTWENPYLTVQGQMMTLHVMLADANTSSMGLGGLLRPVGARRQDLNVRGVDLPAALNAVPPTAWPYGRVIAIEEAHDAPASARPELRRNVEKTIKTLSDLGVVVYEWQEGGPSLR